MIKEDIQKAILVNLKAQKALEVKVLRFILSEIKYGEIAKQKELTDDEAITLLIKEVKKRKEAIEMFKKAKRMDLVDDEEKQVLVIEGYLPKQIGGDELEKIVEEVLSKTVNKTNLGKVIGLVMAKVKGRADGSVVSSIVRRKMTV